jgi:hypothetical protein
MPLDAADHSRVQSETKESRNAGQRWARARRREEGARPPVARQCAVCGVELLPARSRAPQQTLPACAACFRAHHQLGTRGTDRPRYGEPRR